MFMKRCMNVMSLATTPPFNCLISFHKQYHETLWVGVVLAIEKYPTFVKVNVLSNIK